MLVLSRKANEAIVIDGNIVVTVLHVIGRSVRIGIEAPRDVPINRSEIEARKRDRQQPVQLRGGLGK